MKPKLLSLFSIFLVSTSLFAQQPQGVVLNDLTLEACIEQGLANSVAIANAKLDYQKAKADVGVIKADGLPQASLSTGFTHNFKIPVAFLPASTFDRTAPPDLIVPARFGVNYGANLSGSFTQLLFDGTYLLGLKAASTYSQLTEKLVTRTEIDVRTNVSKAFYGVLIAKQRLGLLEANQKRLEALLNDTKALYKAGIVEKLDADRIEVTFNSIKIEVQKMQRLLELSTALLKFQMGLQAYDQISVKGELKDLESNTAALKASLATNDDNFDYQQRIETNILENQIVLERYNVRRFRMGYYPRLTFGFNYGANAGGNQFGDVFKFTERWFTQGSYSLGLSIPIFDGLRKHYQIQGAKVGLLKAENTLKETKRGIDLEIKQSKISLRNALETLEAQQKNMELAREVARITKVKYKEGVGSNMEVIEAENSFITAETNYYAALYDAVIAQTDLDKARGELNKK